MVKKLTLCLCNECIIQPVWEQCTPQNSAPIPNLQAEHHQLHQLQLHEKHGSRGATPRILWSSSRGALSRCHHEALEQSYMSNFSIFPNPSNQKHSYFVPMASSILDIHYQKLQVDWLVPGKGCITQMSIITTKNIASKFLNHVCETTHIISQHHGYFYETNKWHNKGTREHLSSLECKCETLGTKIIQQWRKCE